MLCWLVFGEHAALGRDVPQAANVNLTLGIPHMLHVEFAPRTSCASPWGGLTKCFLCLLVFGDHAALGRDVSQAANVVVTGEYHILHVESAPRMTVIPRTAPPPGKA